MRCAAWRGTAGLSDAAINRFVEKADSVAGVLAGPRAATATTAAAAAAPAAPAAAAAAAHRSSTTTPAPLSVAASRLVEARDQAQMLWADIGALARVQATASVAELLALLVERVQQRAQSPASLLLSSSSSSSSSSSVKGVPDGARRGCKLARLLQPESPEEEHAAAVLGHFVGALQRFEEGRSSSRSSSSSSSKVLAHTHGHLEGMMEVALRNTHDWAAAQTEHAFHDSGGRRALVTVTSATGVEGREWDYVFVPGMAASRMPRRRQRVGPLPPLDEVRHLVGGGGGGGGGGDGGVEGQQELQWDDVAEWWAAPNHLESERRVFHSCCTRARVRTVVTSSRSLGGQRTTVPPSPFLAEVKAAAAEEEEE